MHFFENTLSLLGPQPMTKFRWWLHRPSSRATSQTTKLQDLTSSLHFDVKRSDMKKMFFFCTSLDTWNLKVPSVPSAKRKFTINLLLLTRFNCKLKPRFIYFNKFLKLTLLVNFMFKWRNLEMCLLSRREYFWVVLNLWRFIRSTWVIFKTDFKKIKKKTQQFSFIEESVSKSKFTLNCLLIKASKLI